MNSWKMCFIIAYGGGALLVGLMYVMARLLWPWLIENRWILEDWEEWR